MIEISYDNVMNGLNKGINMTCLCPSQMEADHLFRNAIDLWYVPTFTRVKRVERSLEYGPEDHTAISIRFKNLSSFSEQNWKGFRGIFLIHPDINPDSIRESRVGRELEIMKFNNERYLEQWRA